MNDKYLKKKKKNISRKSCNTTFLLMSSFPGKQKLSYSCSLTQQPNTGQQQSNAGKSAFLKQKKNLIYNKTIHRIVKALSYQ